MGHSRWGFDQPCGERAGGSIVVGCRDEPEFAGRRQQQSRGVGNPRERIPISPARGSVLPFSLPCDRRIGHDGHTGEGVCRGTASDRGSDRVGRSIIESPGKQGTHGRPRNRGGEGILIDGIQGCAARGYGGVIDGYHAGVEGDGVCAAAVAGRAAGFGGVVGEVDTHVSRGDGVCGIVRQTDDQSGWRSVEVGERHEADEVGIIEIPTVAFMTCADIRPRATGAGLELPSALRRGIRRIADHHHTGEGIG